MGYNEFMINIVGNEIMRGGQRIGYLRGNDVFSHEGRKLGYVEGSRVFNYDGKKLGYLEGDFLNTADGKQIRIEDNHQHVSGGSISDAERAAVRLLLGD